MTNIDSSNFESNLLLLSVVKILSDHGLNKTLKKLQKETNCKQLNKENLPDFIANTNYNKLIPKLLKKTIKSSKDNNNESGTLNTVCNVVEDSKVLKGFVKSSQILEGTIETPKREDSVTYYSTTASNSGETLSNDSNSINDKTISNISDCRSGVPFKRINDDVWLSKIDKEELKNNNYYMKNDCFALKDAEQLSLVKGKDFRSQKYKKKRSSWKGSGEITNSVNSVFFSDSDS